MAQFIQKFDGGGTFKTNTDEYDSTQLLRDYEAEVLSDIANHYQQQEVIGRPRKRRAIERNNNYKELESQNYRAAADQISALIKSGAITRTGASTFTGEGLDNNNIHTRHALDALNRALAKQTKKSSEELKNDNSFLNYFNQQLYGGNFTSSEADLQQWLDLDALKEDGTRDKVNRLNKLAELISGYGQSINNSNYDFSKSPFGDYSGFQGYIAKTLEDLKNGYDATDAFNLTKLGIGADTLKLLFADNYTTGTPEETEYTKRINALKKELTANLKSGAFTQEQYDQLWEQGQKDIWNELYGQTVHNANMTDWENAYQTFGNTNWINGNTADPDNPFYMTNSFGDVGNEQLTPLLKIWTGTGDEIEDQETPWVKKGNNQQYLKNLWKSICSGATVNWNQVQDGLNNGQIFRLAILQAINDNDENVVKADDTHFYLKDSIDLNTGTAMMYDTDQNQLYKVWVDPTKTPALKSYLKNLYIKNNPQPVQGSVGRWKKGGSLEIVKKVRKAEFGQKFFNSIENNAKQAQAEVERQTAIREYGDDSEESINRSRVGHSKMFSTEADHAKKTTKDGVVQDVGMDNSDYLRLASALTDIASIGVSYTGAGMPVAGLMQLGSTATDLVADLTDSTVTWGDTLKNLAVNVGLGVATTFGAGAVAKAGKIGKTIAKLLPVGLAAVGATSMLNDPEFQKTMKKMGNLDFKKLTSKDLKNLNIALKIISGGHHAAKSAAGDIGMIYGKNNAITRWGNNAKNYDAATIANAEQVLATKATNPSQVSKLAELRALNTLAKQGNFNALNKVNAAGGFKPGATIKLDSDGKVTIGGQKVEKSVAEAMLAAAKKAHNSGKDADEIKAAMIEAFKNHSQSGYNKGTTIPAFTPEEFQAATEAELLTKLGINNTGLTGNQGKIGNALIDDITTSKYNINGKTNVKGGDLPAEFEAIYKTAAAAEADTAKKHAAGLKAVNDAFKALFPATPEETIGASALPTFDFEGLNSGKGWFGMKKYLTRTNAGYTDENPGVIARAYRSVVPERAGALDVNTPEGRKNVMLINDLRQEYKAPGIWGDTFNNDIEYNAGFGTFKTNIQPQMDAMQAYSAARQLEGIKKQNLNNAKNLYGQLSEAQQTKLAKMIEREPNKVFTKKELQQTLGKVPTKQAIPGESPYNASNPRPASTVSEIRKVKQLLYADPDLPDNVKGSGRNIIISQLQQFKADNGLSTLEEAYLTAKQQAINEGRSFKSVLRNPNSQGATSPTHTPAYSNSNPYSLRLNNSMSGVKETSNKMSTYTTKNGKVSLTKEAIAELRRLGIPFDKRDKNGKPYYTVYGKYNSNWWKTKLGINDPNVQIHNIYQKDGQYYWWKQGGKIQQLNNLRSLRNFTEDNSSSSEELSKFEQGGIIKAERGTDIRWNLDGNGYFDWYKTLYGLKEVGGQENLDNNERWGNVSDYHNQSVDLRAAAAGNYDYTANANQVGGDINYYLQNYFSGDDLSKFVEQYNNDAQKIRNTWEVQPGVVDYKLNETKGMSGHNDLWYKLFSSRGVNGNKGYIEYKPNEKDTLGTNTWQRRMDRYQGPKDWNEVVQHYYDENSNFFGTLNDDVKNRIHEVTLKGGKKGYVFKKSNGDIELIDDPKISEEIAKQLKLVSTYTPREKLTEQDNDKKTSKETATPTSPTAAYAESWEQFIDDEKSPKINGKKFAETLSDLLPNVASTARLAAHLGLNRRIRDNAMKKGTVLIPGLEGHRWEYGNHNGYQTDNKSADALSSAAKRNPTSDASTNKATQLDYELKAAQLRDAAIDKYMQPLEQSKEKQYILQDELKKINRDALIKNLTALNNLKGYRIDTENAYLNNLATNLTNYLTELDNKVQTKQNEKKALDAQLDANRSQNMALQILKNDKEYQELLSKKNRTYAEDTMLLQKERQARKATDQIILQKRYPGINTSYSDADLQSAQEIYKSALSSLRSGGRVERRVDDTEVKKRDSDLKALRKQVWNNIKASQHSLDNLSRGTLIHLKKMMNA